MDPEGIDKKSELQTVITCISLYVCYVVSNLCPSYVNHSMLYESVRVWVHVCGWDDRVSNECAWLVCVYVYCFCNGSTQHCKERSSKSTFR